MRYTEDYRRLVGLAPYSGRLISGLEGYKGRNLVGGVREDVLDQLALGFGGFGDLGYFYTARGGIWPNMIDNRFQADSDAAAVLEFNKMIPNVPPETKLTLIHLSAEGETSGTVVVESYGTKGTGVEKPVAVTYQFVVIDRNGATVETKTATYYTEQEARTELERQRQFTPPGGRVELRANGRVLGSSASTQVGANYQIYKNGLPHGLPMYVAEDVAYANLQVALDQGWSTDAYKLVKVSTGETVASGMGKRVAVKTVQWKIKKIEPDGSVQWPVGGASNEGAPMIEEAYAKWVSSSGSDETIVLIQDGVEVKSSKGAVQTSPRDTYWIAREYPGGRGDVTRVEIVTLDAAKAKAVEYAKTLPYNETAILTTKDHVEIIRYAGTKTKRPEPEITPEPSLEPSEEMPDFTKNFMSSMSVGFETFKTKMTEQLVPPVPNWVWVGIGSAAIIGVGVAAATIKKK